MKMIFFHCSEVEAEGEWETRQWADALVVFFCPEKGDTPEQLSEAYDQLEKTLTYLEEDKVILTPAPFLSYSALPQEDIKAKIESINKKLVKKGVHPTTFDFKDSKSTRIDLLGHKLSVAYREIPKE